MVILAEGIKRQITLNNIHRVGRLSLLLVSTALLMTACQFKINESAINNTLRTPLVLSNNKTVSNCVEYRAGRASYGVLEAVNNRMVANEYLPCSLTTTNPLGKDEALGIAQQLLSLRVRQLPLSIAQLYASQTLLREANFHQIENKLLWSQDQQNIEILVKARDAGSQTRYLIWVSDVIRDGNYHSHYPAWVEISGKSERITVSPVYESGY